MDANQDEAVEIHIFDNVEYLCCDACDSVMMTALFLLLSNKQQAVALARCPQCFTRGRMAGHEHYMRSVIVLYDLTRKEWTRAAKAGVRVLNTE